MYRKGIKRALDFSLSFLGLVLISPVFILLIILLFFCNRGAGVFFTQERPGYKGRIFRVVKFKSMTEEKDNKGNLLPNEKRLTPMGRFIRKTSLDELPQLINVLKGDMSLIGPRPLLPTYLNYYTTEEHRRHNVRPGLSGLAQVQGRNNLCWDIRLKLDTYYVDHLSFKLDFLIFIKTIKSVLLAKDIVVVPGEKFQPLHIERQNEDKKIK